MKSTPSSMINRHLCLFAMIVLVVFSQFALCGTYGGGAGTSEDPYLISTAEHMQEIGANEGDWDKCFVLVSDIDLSMYAGQEYNIIGTKAEPFAGVFDGDGHVIRNLTIETKVEGIKYFGLFGWIYGDNSEIKNLGMENVSISGGYKSYRVGGLVGINFGTVSNCYVLGDVRGYMFVGGIAGDNRGAIIDCYSMCTVSGYEDIGGLVGFNYEALVAGSYSTGSVVGFNSIGGVVGENLRGNITDCYAIGNIKGVSSIGGAVGDNSGTLTNSYATGVVSGDNNIGGLVGVNRRSITGSYATGKVNGHRFVGGLIGNHAHGSEMLNCFAIGNVSGNEFVGGVVGYNYLSSIHQCSAYGDVEGKSSMGGLVGKNTGHSPRNCFAVGDVSGDENVGGLIGWYVDYYGSSVLKYCYSAGRVSGDEYVGGLIGNSEENYYSCSFWNSDMNPGLRGAGEDVSPIGIFGKTTIEMQIQSTFTEYGWDFVGEDVNGTEEIWKMPESGYPLLSSQSTGLVPDVVGLTEIAAEAAVRSAGLFAAVEIIHSKSIEAGTVISQEPSGGSQSVVVRLTVSDGFPYGGGSGSEGDPYQIWTGEQMEAVGNNRGDWGKNFVLMQNIKVDERNGIFINAIGDYADMFTGVFDGSGYTISGLKYKTENEIYSSCIGLFGVVGNDGRIIDVGLTEVNIDARKCNYVGGLVSTNSGTITNCFVSGNVIGADYVGGLVGCNEGEVVTCNSMCFVSGTDQVGGLIGDNYGSITDCLAVEDVSGCKNIGGLVGETRDGSITSSYASGNVSGFGNRNGFGSVGGLVGYNRSVITGCFARGGVSGIEYVGGLVGHTFNIVTNSYCTGDVKGTRYIGGFAGYNGNVITKCFTGSTVSGVEKVGGMAGVIWDQSVNECFWNRQVNPSITGVGEIWVNGGTEDPAGVVGIRNDEMRMESTFIDAGWDFVGEGVNGVEDIWKIRDGVTYPQLSWYGVGGDVAGRWRVDMVDLAEVVKHYGNFNAECDFDGSGIVDFGDVLIMADNWLED